MTAQKIMFIIPDLNAGGAERIICTLANHLDRKLFKPSILLMRKEGPYLDILNPDVEIIDIQKTRIRQSLVPILKEIRKRKPDIVFSGYGEVNAYISFFIKCFPKVKFIARETNVVSQHVVKPHIKFFYKFYNNFHQIIAQSDDMKADLIENFTINPKKISKINNPVDFEFIEEKIANDSKPYALDQPGKHVVSIGNLSYRKGFDNLLKSFAYLKNDPIHLHILGDGRDKDLLHQMKKDLDLTQVHFHGQQKNPYAYLANADLFVLSSRYEGFPNVLLEAGACGTYALANQCPGGINEIVQPGINADIANIEEHEGFALHLKHLIENKPASQDPKKSIRSRFSKEIILKQYQDLLLNLVK